MHISHHGKLTDERTIRLGFIGCGSHSFRNLYASLQFLPISLEAVCDLDQDKAAAFARKFGAGACFGDFREMIREVELDAVMVVTNYDEHGRPRYPAIVGECLQAGLHVWMEKPPAASVAALEELRTVVAKSGRHVITGMKKMFFPANMKARALMMDPDFGAAQLVNLCYPQQIPETEAFRRYLVDQENVAAVVSFLDHLCHPTSLLVYLLGMPESLFYQRSPSGAGSAIFTFPGGAVGVLNLTHGAAENCGMEQTTIVGQHGRRIVVDNNIRVRYDRHLPAEPQTSYGSSPNFYTGTTSEASAIWEPEFSLGQLYNKGIFIQGFYHEILALVDAVREQKPPTQGTLDQAIMVTRIFEGFAAGPGKVIAL